MDGPVFVRGKELDREKTYTLSATLFIIQGGDGYDVLSKCKKTLEAENSLDCFKIIDEILNLPLELCYRTEFEIWKTVQTKFSDEFIRQAHQPASVYGDDLLKQIYLDDENTFKELSRKTISRLLNYKLFDSIEHVNGCYMFKLGYDRVNNFVDKNLSNLEETT